jgi:hypothetical protein
MQQYCVAATITRVVLAAITLNPNDHDIALAELARLPIKSVLNATGKLALRVDPKAVINVIVKVFSGGTEHAKTVF